MKQFLRLAETDPDSFRTLIRETVENLENYRQQFRETILAGNLPEFRNQVDKSKMIFAVLRAGKLQKMLSQSVQLLEEPDLSKEERQSVADQLDDALQTLIATLKNAS